MTDFKPHVAEIWPLAVDDLGIWLISGRDAWRTGPVPSGSGADFEAKLELFDYGIVGDRVPWMHSTSWRDELPRLIVTFAAWVRPAGGDLVRGTWRHAMPLTVAASEAVGPARPHPPAEPPVPTYFHVLMHALRHMKWLSDPAHDATSAAVLASDGRWARHLAPFTPELARMFTEPYEPAA
jgi:hypothetical protein